MRALCKTSAVRNGPSFGLIPPPLTPPRKGEVDYRITASAKPIEDWRRTDGTQNSPAPLWGGVRGGGKPESSRQVRSDTAVDWFSDGTGGRS
jgi:hypothetical protein